MRNTAKIALILVLILSVVACGGTNQKKGTAIGAGAGAVIGAVIGHQAGNTVVGAVVGAAVGGAAGAYIGNYMDKQAEEMQRDLEGAHIERVGEGIIITFESGLLFEVNQSVVSPAARENLVDLARILNKYEDTNILLEGHTDATGDEDYNQGLSEKRAGAVGNQLKFFGVDPLRFTIAGYGESQPVADNSTAEGRSMNRRVEVAVYANDELVEAAERRAGG